MSGCISAPHDRGATGIQWVQPGLLLDTHVPRVSPLLFYLSSSVFHVRSCQRVLTVPAFPPRAPCLALGGGRDVHVAKSHILGVPV